MLHEALHSAETERKNTFAVDSRDNKLHYLYNKYMRNTTEENAEALQKEIDYRMKIDKTFEEIFPHHMEGLKAGTLALPSDFDCYKSLIAKYEEQCGKLDDYSFKFAGTFAAECEALKAFPSAIDSTHHRINKVCGQPSE